MKGWLGRSTDTTGYYRKRCMECEAELSGSADPRPAAAIVGASHTAVRIIYITELVAMVDARDPWYALLLRELHRDAVLGRVCGRMSRGRLRESLVAVLQGHHAH